MALHDTTERKRSLYAAARAAGRDAIEAPSALVGARYDARRDAIDLLFRCGASIIIPRALVPELEGASKADLRAVSASIDPEALECRSLDVDIFVPGLIERVFGARLLASVTGRRGGKKRSKSKADAARRNGALGGRPRKRRTS